MVDYGEIEPLAKLKIGRVIDRLSKENAERTAKINADFAARGLSRSGPLDAARLRSRLQMVEQVCREVSSIWSDLVLKQDTILAEGATAFIMTKVQEYADGFSRQAIQSSMAPSPEGLINQLRTQLALGIQVIAADIRRDLEIQRREQSLASHRRDETSNEAPLVMGANQDLRPLYEDVVAAATGPVPSSDASVQILCAYSHEDESLRDELEKHLSPLKREGLVRLWHDRRIGPGKEWDREIDLVLERAEIILLLVSPDFIASDYCYDREVKRALERHRAGSARVIPVVLRPVDWHQTPIAKLQALPKDAKPVTLWADRDEAFLDVARGIRRAAEELAERSEHGSCPILLTVREIFYTRDFDGVVVSGELRNPTGMSFQVTDFQLSIPSLNAALEPYSSPFGTGRYNGPRWWSIPLDLPARKVAIGALFFPFSNPSWRGHVSRGGFLHAVISANLFPPGSLSQPVEIYGLPGSNPPASPAAG